jgi:putative PEP-CTERM system histidine kinase
LVIELDRSPTVTILQTAATVGWGICALAQAVVAVAVRPHRGGLGRAQERLRVAAAGTAAMAMAGAWLSEAHLIATRLSDLVMLLVTAFWLWPLEPLVVGRGPVERLRLPLLWAGPMLVTVGLIVSFTPGLQWMAPLLGTTLPVGGILLALLGLLTLEQLFRASASAIMPSMRWFCVGVGAVMLGAVVHFAERLGSGTIAAGSWTTHALVIGAAAYPILRGSRAMPDWSSGLIISRRVALFTTTVLIVSGYLVAMSLVGLRLFDLPGNWGRIAQGVFTVLAATVLVAMLFSGALQRRLLVFISKNFYRSRYDYRREWLRFIGTLSETDGVATVHQRAIRAVAQIVDSPRGVLWVRDEQLGVYRETDSWPRPGSELRGLKMPVNASLPSFFDQTAWLVDLAELRASPTLYQGLSITASELGAPDSALVVPVLHIDQLYGWLVLERPESLADLTYEDRDLLKTACRHIAAHLSQFDADARLTEARQFEAYSRMTAFVMHDLKNLAAQLRLIVQNAERHKRNPSFVDDAMSTIGMSVNRMSKLIAQLASGEFADAPKLWDLGSIAERVAVRCADRLPVPRVVIIKRGEVLAEFERIGSVLEHAIRNAQDATPQGGEVRIEVDCERDRPSLRIVDTGKGMDPEFVRDRLFRPFDSTKGPAGMGIGAFQIREYMRGLGGSVEVSSTLGLGTTLTLVFPPQSATTRTLKVG